MVPVSEADSTGAQLIKRDRKARNLSRRDLARLAGVSQSHIRNVENGHRPVTEALAERLADVFGVPASRYRNPPQGGDA